MVKRILLGIFIALSVLSPMSPVLGQGPGCLLDIGNRGVLCILGCCTSVTCATDCHGNECCVFVTACTDSDEVLVSFEGDC